MESIYSLGFEIPQPQCPLEIASELPVAFGEAHRRGRMARRNAPYAFPLGRQLLGAREFNAEKT